MKKILPLLIILITATMGSAQNTLYLTANGETRTATLADNDAGNALVNLLADGPITVTMNDYGGFEKVGSLPQSLPTADTQITTVPGDIMLYQGDKMVIFYNSNSWAYTPLGKIDDSTAENVKEFLDNGAVNITLSLSVATGIESVSRDANTSKKVYDLSGRLISGRPSVPGCYIINGEKVVIK